MIYYIAQSGKETFSLDEDEFRDAIFRGEIQPEDFYFCEGLNDWKPVSEFRTALVSPSTASMQSLPRAVPVVTPDIPRPSAATTASPIIDRTTPGQAMGPAPAPAEIQ